MPDRQQLQEYYRGLPDDDLARIALTAELTPEARDVIGTELQGRGLKDLSVFKRQMEEDAVLTNPARYNEVSWEMERKWKLSIGIAGLVMGAWVSAATLPMDILSMDQSQSIGTKLEIVGILGAVMALSIYLGFRARRQGRRLAFYLRAVVTLVLLCTSTVIVLASRWMAR
jgi:hypothetical protein